MIALLSLQKWRQSTSKCLPTQTNISYVTHQHNLGKVHSPLFRKQPTLVLCFDDKHFFIKQHNPWVHEELIWMQCLSSVLLWFCMTCLILVLLGAAQHAQVSVCDSLLKADPTTSIRDKSRQDGQTSTNLLFAFAISPREWQGGLQNRADEVAHVWWWLPIVGGCFEGCQLLAKRGDSRCRTFKFARCVLLLRMAEDPKR